MIYISLIVLVIIICLSFASTRSRRGDAVGIPLIAIGVFTFLYVLQPLRLIATGSIGLYLTDWQASKSILLAALFLPFFMWGWISERNQRHCQLNKAWNPRLLWNIGAWAASVGVLLHIVFLEVSGGIIHSYSKPHGGAMAWEENTAYLYDSLFWVLSGSVMMIIAAAHLRPSKWRRRVPIAFALTFIAYALLTGGRGPLFSTVGALFVARTIASRQIVSIKRALGVLAIVGIGILLLVGFRGILHLGDQVATTTPTLSSALTSITDVDDWNQSHGSTGLEFLYHAGAIDTVDQSGRLDYGISWLYFLVINPIPKLLWPGKHYPESPGITTGDIFSYTGIPIVAGSMSGLVADVYIRFGYLSVAFMFFLGKCFRKLHLSALRLESPLSSCAYVMLYSMSLNLFAQNVRSNIAVIPYSMLPVLLYTVISHFKRTTCHTINTTHKLKSSQIFAPHDLTV